LRVWHGRRAGAPAASEPGSVGSIAAVDFYDQVLRELVFALGAALFVANVWALVRRRADARRAARHAAVKTRPGSPVRGNRLAPAGDDDLAQAPVGRSVLYAILGFVVMVWGLASIVNS